MMSAQPGKVTVICKVPMGILLRTFKRQPGRVPQGILSRAAFFAQSFKPTGKEIVIHAGENEIDKKFWEAWRRQNGDSSLVKNLLIYVKPSPAQRKHR